MFGKDCLFRHEKKNFTQLHRHHFTPQLYMLESLFSLTPDSDVFFEAYQPACSRLAVFAEATSAYQDETVVQGHE